MPKHGIESNKGDPIHKLMHFSFQKEYLGDKRLKDEMLRVKQAVDSNKKLTYADTLSNKLKFQMGNDHA